MFRWYHRTITTLGVAALVSCQADLSAPTTDHPGGPQLTGEPCSSEVGEKPNQDLQGELYGFLYSGTTKVCLADLADGFRIVLTPLSGSGPAGWDNTFVLVPHENEQDGAYNWNDVHSTDHDGCYDPPMAERHTGSINDGTEHHCIVAGRYRVSLQSEGVTIQQVDLDYIQAKAPIFGDGGRLVVLADESFATTGYLGGDHIIIFNIGAAVPDVAVNEGFEADAPGTDLTLAGWAPMPSTDLVVATNEPLRVDVGQTTAPGTLDQEYSVLHRITWETGVSTGWFYSSIGFNHTRAHTYGGAARCVTLLHEVALPGDIHATGVSVPAARKFSRTVDVGGGCAGRTHPDLVPQTIAPVGILPSTGSGTVNVTVANIGTGASVAGTVKVYLSTTPTFPASPVLLGSAATPVVSANGNVVVAVPVTLSSAGNGTRYLFAEVDAGRTSAELSEGNNRGSVATAIGDLADLRVTSITGPSSVALYATGAYNYTLNVRNHGTAGTGSTGWYYSLAMSGDAVFSANDPRVDGGGGPGPLSPFGQLGDAGIRSVFFTPPATAVPGTVYLVANLDTTNTIAESNETNNTGASTAITLTANGDMRVDSLAGPASIAPGATVTVPVFVKNYGTDPARPAKVKVYLSTDNTLSAGDSLIGSLTDTPLMTAGIVRTENVSVTVAAGQAVSNYYLIAKVDADSTVYESNEGNNTTVRTTQVSISVPSIPDLIVNTFLAPVQDSAFYGNHYTWNKGTARNIGTGSAAAGWVGRLYLSTDTTWDGSDLLVASTTFGSLAASTNVSIATTAGIPGSAWGNYYLIYVVDATGVTTEANESNNVGVSATTMYVEGLP